ncbi:hypothetical protein MMC18_005092 [Xylographa bjoerkii]|nr:hypothetical protein [Xylographa bjoerkii]
MAVSDVSNKLACEMEEGQIIHLPDGKREEASSPTASSAVTAVPGNYSPIESLKTVRTWPKQVLNRVSSWGPQKLSNSNVVIHQLENSPMGFPYVATFLDSEDSFMIYRRFGFLHARLLLNKQDELRVLERDLRELDHADSLDEETQIFLRVRTKDEKRDPRPGYPSRKALFTVIEQKALEYGRLLLQAQQLAALNRPADRDQRSVQTLLENENPLGTKESTFIYEKEDLVTLRPGREAAFLDAFVEKMLKTRLCKPVSGLFCSEETKAKSKNPDIHYFTRERINAFVTFIITGFILIVLVVPIWALYHITVSLNTAATSPTCIGVLLVSTLIFSAILSLFTKARRHEILAAAAG